MASSNSYISIIIFLILQFSVSAQNESRQTGELEFIENKGQWNENILFKADLHAGALFLEKECLTFNFVNPYDIAHSHDHHDHNFDKNTIPVAHYHAYKVSFLNANPDGDLKGFNITPDYCNYYIGNDRTKWTSHVRKYKTVKYSDIYPNIDLKIYSNDILLKYDFELKPGADHRDIILEYDGVDDLQISDGNLIIKTSVNEIVELKPYAYQEINGKIVEIPCRYRLNENRVSFILNDKYDKSKSLLIDPTLVFSTYTGSTADNWGYTATFDHYGNVYSGGIVYEIGYPTSTGAFQEDHCGNWDIGIIKYDPFGITRLFATYLGGLLIDLPHSLIANELNELLVYGTTGSSDFPTSSTAYDTTFNGGVSINSIPGVFQYGSDIYVAKFSPDGSQLMASTYIGGTDNDGLNTGTYSLDYNYGDCSRGEIITDDHNDVYVGSCTFSSDFPLTAFPFQIAYNGKLEGVVFKLDYNLTTLVWSSYLGGSDADAVYSICPNENYDILVAGGTKSSDFPTTPGAYQPNYLGGMADGFIAHISQDGYTLLRSGFWGSPEYDQAYFVRADKNNNVYITGQTQAVNSTLIYNALYNLPNSGQFITKFPPSLDTIEWSTVFGTGNGIPNISPTAFEVDFCKRIYLSGWGKQATPPTPWGLLDGTKNMDITPNAFQDTTDGQDFYFMVIAPDADSLEYASFFGEIAGINGNGEDHVDGGTSRFDKRGTLYQSACGSCGGGNGFPTYPPNVWSSTNNSSNCNNAVFKFNIHYDFAIAEFYIPTTGCAPFNVQFDNNSLGASYIWDFGDGSPMSTLSNPTHTYNNSGLYNITLIANDPASCNLSDTITKQIMILGDTSYRIPEITICKGYQKQIGITPSDDTSITYLWIPSTGISDPSIAKPYASPSKTTDYYLLVSNGICTDTIYQQVIIIGSNVYIGNDTSICLGDTVVFNAGPGFVSYLWQDGSTGQTYIANQSGVIWVDVEDSVGCKSKDAVQLTIPIPDVDIGNDTSICNGETIFFNAFSFGFTSYMWSTGSTYHGIACNTPGDYWVRVSDSTNCYGYDTVNLQLYPLPNPDIGNDTSICIGDSIILDPGPGFITYLWNDAYPAQSVFCYLPGDYWVRVSDSNNCIGYDTINVQLYPFTQGNAGPDVNICFGDNITLTASGGINYSWSTGVQLISIDVSPTVTTTYTVTVTDVNGCSNSDEVIVTVNALPFVELGNDTTLCQGDALTLDAGPSTGSYLWQDNSTNPTFVVTQPGTYWVMVSEICGTKSDTININYFPLLNINLGNDTALCPADTLILDATSSNSTYLWQDSSTNPTFFVTQSGAYWVEVKDICGTTNDSINIYYYSPKNIDLGNDTIICQGEILILDATTANVTYLWQDNSTNPTLSVYQDGVYWVAITDSCDTYYDSIYVNFSPLPDINLGNDTSLCEGEFLLLDATTANADYQWQDNSTNSVLIVDQQGNYWVKVTVNNCSNYDTISVNFLPVPVVNLGADTTICSGNYLLLDATTPNATYLWQDNSTEPAFLVSQEGQYWVVITEDKCSSSDTIYVTVEECKVKLEMPNAITINNDGYNDVFSPIVMENVIQANLIIFNRWGRKIFKSSNLTEGWDGKHNGKKCSEGVYFWIVKYKGINRQDYQQSGSVTVFW